MSESRDLVIRLSDDTPKSLQEFDAPEAITVVKDETDLAEASKRRQSWAEITRLANAEFDPQIDLLKNALSKEQGRKKKFLAPIVARDSATKQAMEAYYRDEFAKKQAQRDRLERAVREVVEKQTLADVTRLNEEGKTEEAKERLADLSAPLPLPAINTKTAPKVAGSQVRFPTKWKLVDIEKVNVGFFESVKTPIKEKIDKVVKSTSPREAERVVGGIEVTYEPIVARSPAKKEEEK